MQFHLGYGYLCLEADNAESDTEVKKVIYTVKSYGATNTVEVEIENQKETESQLSEAFLTNFHTTLQFTCCIHVLHKVNLS